MRCLHPAWALAFGCALTLAAAPGDPGGCFSVATFNLEGYLDAPRGSRPAKPAAAKAQVRESLRALHADVVALQEIGGTNALLELRASLQAEGLDYPFWEHVPGFDTNTQVALLSRFPLVARRPHTQEGFLLGGRRFRVSRGFAEVEVQVSPRYRFTLLAAHLKSRREVADADQADLREQEAVVLRGIIEERLRAAPDLNLVVLGDFNDLKDSVPVRTILGRGRTALFDPRPAERNGDDVPAPEVAAGARNVTWTYYFFKEDTYSRVDYLLISAGMRREWRPEGTYVLALPHWGLASDHRPVVASFRAEDQ